MDGPTGEEICEIHTRMHRYDRHMCIRIWVELGQTYGSIHVLNVCFLLSDALRKYRCDSAHVTLVIQMS
jgi:hypothetical protein